MCREKKRWRFTIERLVFGTKDLFAVVKKSHFHTENEVTMPRLEYHFLTDICNN